MTLHINQQTDILGVIDVQNDFLPGGSLAVHNGDHIIPIINTLLQNCFRYAFATQDWHPKNHISFASSHRNKNVSEIIDLPYGKQMLWPDHAVAEQWGSAFPKTLITNHFQMILRKGWNQNIDSYSAFKENDQKTTTGLEGWLKHIGIKRVFLSGLAEDFCVAYSAQDAISAGFETYIIEDAVKAVAIPLKEGQTSASEARKKLSNLGVKYINSTQIVQNKTTSLSPQVESNVP